MVLFPFHLFFKEIIFVEPAHFYRLEVFFLSDPLGVVLESRIFHFV